MAPILNHPTLGDIQGVSKDGVVQYLGIKYATIQNRLDTPCPLLDNGGRGIIDATVSGPSAVQPPQAIDMEYSVIQQKLPKPEIVLSDTECLNLNVTVPEGAQKNLPVFVFIHGGGFMMGSNSWPHLDHTRIVKLSSQKSLPVIGVLVNYRLGHLGFMTSKELRAAGVKSNRALLDQRAALQWVQSSIAGFGGDPSNVTIMGESAGAISSMFHLSASQPLFRRVISMSGTPLMRKAMTQEEEEKSYNGVLSALKIKDEGSEERIKTLLEVPFEKFLTIPRNVGWAWGIDGDFITEESTFSQLATLAENRSAAVSVMPAAQVASDLILGDCQLDTSTVAIFLGGRKPGIGKAFSEFLKNRFSHEPKAVESALSAYGISPHISDDEAFLHVLQFATDIAFLAPVYTYAKAWPGNAYVYHFNEPNPWDGPWKGQTGHILDVAFLFMNFEDSLTDEQKEIGKAFAENFIKFFNGHTPWPAFKQDEPSALVIGGNDKSRGITYKADVRNPAETGRRREIYQFAEFVGLDAIIDAWNAFRS
ncbi:putative carboxylesterase [Xylogone sp. PMI_703]|nr:putative carboxylesterase [Xylogone sp. PMI_703]